MLCACALRVFVRVLDAHMFYALRACLWFACFVRFSFVWSVCFMCAVHFVCVSCVRRVRVVCFVCVLCVCVLCARE